MPIGHLRSPKRLAAAVALVTALGAFPHKIGLEKVQRARVVENYRPPDVDLARFRQFFPGLDVALVASKLFELKKDLVERKKLVAKISQSDLLVLIDAYLEKAAKDSGIDVGILKYLFYSSGFYVKNPLIVSNWVAANRLNEGTFGPEHVEQDPFLGIDIGISYFKYLQNKFKYKSPYKLLAEYLGFKGDVKKLKQRVLSLNGSYKELFTRHNTLKKAELKLKMTRVDLSAFKFVPLTDFISIGFDKQKTEIEKFVKFIAPQLDLNVNEVFELIFSESSFYFQKRNSVTGALGLMQILPITFEELKRLGVEFRKIVGRDISFVDLKDPYVNLVVGLLHFRYLLDVLGDDYEAAVQAYKIGLYKYLKERDKAPTSKVPKKLKVIGRN